MEGRRKVDLNVINNLQNQGENGTKSHLFFKTVKSGRTVGSVIPVSTPVLKVMHMLNSDPTRLDVAFLL